MRATDRRTPVAFFHILSNDGVDMGWVGYCDAIGEPMIPALLHPNGPDGAEHRSLTDPPAVIGVYNGEAYVPHSWIRKVLKEERDLFVIDAMKIAAENGMKKSKGEMPNASGDANDEAQRPPETPPAHGEENEEHSEDNRDYVARGGFAQRLRRWSFQRRR
ncbi:hypothetical protein [Paraburkholderia hospita]|uniref:hypothetical protein n=1 Tax=Paraburkholderia hospita TaxID=169430 RepID=UPI0008A78692|nr:hypothetical protein [Paraburkholderia hospita]SEI14605.1 hypothetical protein SAMN05192544_102573 [Paraburkholderia hospita]